MQHDIQNVSQKNTVLFNKWALSDLLWGCQLHSAVAKYVLALMNLQTNVLPFQSKNNISGQRDVCRVTSIQQLRNIYLRNMPETKQIFLRSILGFFLYLDPNQGLHSLKNNPNLCLSINSFWPKTNPVAISSQISVSKGVSSLPEDGGSIRSNVGVP